MDSILKEEATVLLAWNKLGGGNDRTICNIKTKLEYYGISYNDDAFCKYSVKVANKVNLLLQNKQNIVGIELCGIARDKHIGFLDDELVNKNVFILYCCASVDSYVRISQKIDKGKLQAMAIPIPCEYTYLLEKINVLCKTSYTKPKNPQISTIYLGHALTNWSKVNTNLSDFMDYICVGLKGFAPKDRNVICLESGYLGFDIPASGIGLNSRRDSVLFTPYDKKELFRMVPYINEALKSHRVILRSRMFFEGEHLWRDSKDVIDKLLRNDNFSIDDGWRMNNGIYSRSFCAVCGRYSTLRYSFPILSLAPAIYFGEVGENECIFACKEGDIKGFKQNIDDFYSNFEKYSSKIAKYRENNVYNFGEASKYLSDFICNNLLN